MSCNNCNNSCDPCSSCSPAGYKCDFSISANPFDQSVWNVTICGATTRVKIPKINETDTKLSTNFNDRTLVYDAEKHQDVVAGEELGGLIELDDLRDVDSGDADSCDLLVYNPGCTDCGDACKPKEAQWENYHIPDAGDCIVEPDEDGYYHVLIKDDCGCIKECKIPVVPNDGVTVDYIRDSVPDDPDYPWYYGQYNDTIDLHLPENAGKYFGKFDLEVTIHYGIQVVHSSGSPNTNFRSLVVPEIGDGEPNVTMQSSILQDQSTYSADSPKIPWGTVSLRGSLTFLVAKGKNAKLHHEFRLRTIESHGNYAEKSGFDGKKVPDDIAGQIDKMKYTGSRLNALQAIIKPVQGREVFEPVVDQVRDTLDAATDKYPNIGK